jgi:hypothetical protein
MKCFGLERASREKDYLKHYCNRSKLVGLVPPLRGLVARANTFPPLPRWATVFRPWRDSAVNARNAGSGVRGGGMGPASGLRGDATSALLDVAVIR